MSDQPADRIREIQTRLQRAAMWPDECRAALLLEADGALAELLAALARLEDDLRLLRRAVTTDDPLDTNDPIVALACAHRQDSGDVDREVEKREAAEQQAQRQAAQIATLVSQLRSVERICRCNEYPSFECDGEALTLVERKLFWLVADQLEAALAAGDAIEAVCTCGHDRAAHGNDGTGHCGASQQCRAAGGCTSFTALAAGDAT